MSFDHIFSELYDFVVDESRDVKRAVEITYNALEVMKYKSVRGLESKIFDPVRVVIIASFLFGTTKTQKALNIIEKLSESKKEKIVAIKLVFYGKKIGEYQLLLDVINYARMG